MLAAWPRRAAEVEIDEAAVCPVACHDTVSARRNPSGFADNRRRNRARNWLDATQSWISQE